MKLDRRASDREEIDENDELLELAGTAWEAAFTRRFLKVEQQQQAQMDLMRAGKLGFSVIAAVSGVASSFMAGWYYLMHLRG